MRVFAGPNGSGKSTMYQQVRSTQSGGRTIDVGIYVNPDDIARELATTKRFEFSRYGVITNEVKFGRFARASGLLATAQDRLWFQAGQQWSTNVFKMSKVGDANRYAQILTQHIVELLLKEKKKFSFETVFSHPSKLEVMRLARSNGYKVYLYYIATDSPDLNIDRVRTRVSHGGHDVPEQLVRKRYSLSLAQLLPALEICYHAFIFDNTKELEPVMFAEMKETSFGRQWAWSTKAIPDWFIRHCLFASDNPAFAGVARAALEDRKKAQ